MFSNSAAATGENNKFLGRIPRPQPHPIVLRLIRNVAIEGAKCFPRCQKCKSLPDRWQEDEALHLVRQPVEKGLGCPRNNRAQGHADGELSETAIRVYQW